MNLIYVNTIGKNLDGEYIYEFYFSEDPDIAWGTDWNVKPASICNLEVPQKQTYEMVKILKTNCILNVIQENSCFSMQDCKDKIIASAWENIDDAEEYPEERLVFPFGIDISDVESMLSKRDLILEENKEIN
jgi:hypothetical protein